MFANKYLTYFYSLIVQLGLIMTMAAAPVVATASTVKTTGWKEIRTAPDGGTGWQYVVCDDVSGWASCELDLIIKLVATPDQLVAIGEKSTIQASVTDAFNKPVEAGVRIGWNTTDGSLSNIETYTDSNGLTSVELTSSKTLGGATVTAEALDYGGVGSIFVPFIDKFVAYPSTFTEWANYGAYFGCTAWSPATATIASGTWFNQTASCSQQQQQWRQDRLQSIVTGNIINNGPPVALYRTISITISQMNVGTKAVAPVCSYSNPKPHQNPGGKGYLWGYDPNTAGAKWGLQLGFYTGLGMASGDQSVIYNGARYSVGALVDSYNYGRNQTAYLYQYCVTPL